MGYPDSFNILKIIALITVFGSLLFAFFLVTVPSRNRQANRLLAAFVVVCAMDISGIFYGKKLQHIPELYEFLKSFTFLLFPLFYYYVRSICFSRVTISATSFIHAMPFLWYNFLIVHSLFSETSHLSMGITDKLFWISNTYLLKGQALVYLIIILRTLGQYKVRYLENYANGSIRLYKWLSGIVFMFILTLPVSIIKDVLSVSRYEEFFTWSIMVLTASALLLIYSFILKGLFYPDFFRGIDTEPDPTGKITSKRSTTKPAQNEPEEETETRIAHLRTHMINKEPFLDPDLTLQDLALQLNIPARELSVLINQQIGQRFFDFINAYRIEKAKELLEKSSGGVLTIQQIYLEVGFNSKSSFNTEFKKRTRLTPTEYKQSGKRAAS